MPAIADLVEAWDTSLDAPKTPETTYGEIHKRIIYFYGTHYFQYIPTLSVLYPDFESRLDKWLGSASDDKHKRILFELLPRLPFFSREDFNKLHQAAFEGPILRWIVDEAGLAFDSPDFQSQLENEAHRHTWYCPISDSMQINEFHHINDLGGIDYRPDWRSLARFGDPALVTKFMSDHHDINGAAPLKRIVLLEDFIGSGSQASDTVKFIRLIAQTCPVLVVPLIVCPAGATMWRGIQNRPQLTFSPVIELKPSDMITSATIQDGSFEALVAELVQDTYVSVVGNNASAPRPYGPYGFPPPIDEGTGAVVVLYSNTPANTLPFIHHESSSWSPLFPRSARVR
jgi:hypothetical protein